MGEKSMKIGIMGTHGVGKSTMALNWASIYKQANPGDSVGILPEIARTCPFPINEGMTEDSQTWIFHAQIKAEQECAAIYDTLVCDRTAIDCMAYAMFANLERWVGLHLPLAMHWADTYDQIIWMRPRHDNDYPADDGFRSTSRSFQVLVDLYLERIVEKYSLHCSQVFSGEPPGSVAELTGVQTSYPAAPDGSSSG
jgi:hypothetical protein